MGGIFGTAGDGSESFFEEGIFNVFRSDEKNALVAQDRADEAQDKADTKAAAVAVKDGQAALVQPGVAQIRTPSGQMAPVADQAARVQLVKVNKFIEKQTAMNERMQKELQKQRQVIQALMKREQAKETHIVSGLDKMLSIAAGAVGVLNASEQPVNGTFLAASRGIDLLSDTGWAPTTKALKLVSAALAIAAYYDAREGIASLWGKVQGGRQVSGLTALTGGATGGGGGGGGGGGISL